MKKNFFFPVSETYRLIASGVKTSPNAPALLHRIFTEISQKNSVTTPGYYMDNFVLSGIFSALHEDDRRVEHIYQILGKHPDFKPDIVLYQILLRIFGEKDRQELVRNILNDAQKFLDKQQMESLEQIADKYNKKK